MDMDNILTLWALVGAKKNRKPRKIYIGGIFPMSGKNYVAPELALGNAIMSEK